MDFREWFYSKLTVGRYPLPQELSKAKYGYVINVSDEYIESCHISAERENTRYFWFPMNEHSSDIGINSIYGALQIMYIAQQAGASVMLHCHAGANRSQAVADAYYYMQTGKHRKGEVDDEIRELNVWLGLPSEHNDNALEMNCRHKKLPPLENLEDALRAFKGVFELDETYRQGWLDKIKINSLNKVK